MGNVGVAISSALIATSVVLATDLQATFLGGSVYAAAADCAKLAKLADGGATGIGSSPRRLTADGYLGVGEICRFVNIDERYQNRLWTITLACDELGGPIRQVEVWRKSGDGRLTVTRGTNVTELVACPSRKSDATKR